MTAARGTGHPKFPLTPQTELPTGHSRPLFSFALSSGPPTFDPTGGCRGCVGGRGWKAERRPHGFLRPLTRESATHTPGCPARQGG